MSLRRRRILWFPVIAVLVGCHNTNHLVMVQADENEEENVNVGTHTPSSFIKEDSKLVTMVAASAAEEKKQSAKVQSIPADIVQSSSSSSTTPGDNSNFNVEDDKSSDESSPSSASFESTRMEDEDVSDKITIDQGTNIDKVPSSFSTATADDDSIHIDKIEDSFLDPHSVDPSCAEDNKEDCDSPPESTIETETVIDATCLQGGGDHDELGEEAICTSEERVVDKHWGTNEEVLTMRDRLRALSADSTKQNKRDRKSVV